MIKITTTLLFFSLLFTACAERGSALTPKNVQQKPMQKETLSPTVKTKVSTVKLKSTKSKTVASTTKSKCTVVPKTQTKTSKSSVKESTSIENDSFFSLSDETKNKISGFLIFVIGLVIFI
jgi:hypothetical protein